MGLHGAIYGDGRVFALLMVYTAASAVAAGPVIRAPARAKSRFVRRRSRRRKKGAH